MIEQGEITNVDRYWDKSGENEIDLIALNETKKTQIIEIKRNEKHSCYNLLKEKVAIMLAKTDALNNFEIEYSGFSLVAMSGILMINCWQLIT